MITLSGISKEFRVYRRDAGFKNAIRSFVHRKVTIVPALTDISFSIGDGEMVGYIGPNGAGKSTTIKIMCGILTPDKGSCVINGRTPWLERQAHVGEIGVVFGQRSQLWWDIPVGDSMALLGDIYGMSKPAVRDSLGELSQILELGDLLKTPTRQLSLGQRMRCEIAAALLHRPKTLFLDEPTIGLDAVSKLAVRAFIKKINAERGTTVILTTHDMQDIDALTERILLIGKGRLLLDGRLSEIKQRYVRVKSLVAYYSGAEIPALPEGFTAVASQPGRIEVAFDSDAIPLPAAIRLLSERMVLTDLSVNETTVDDMVVSLYEDMRL
ncbi:MAG: ATP-binding cassette domain-containing protein [Clostridia bacterium]|nr:ATP-binding cassette domain-containing protein [Clostridia bacterium]